MRELYERVEKRIEALDFEALYPGFHACPFALYNSEKVYFCDRTIPKTDSFIGNTAIEYGGRFIAIWNIEDDGEQDDAELLAANIVHEMFHAFQRESGIIGEYPNDLKMLCYPDNEENYLFKINENRLLASSIAASKKEKKLILETLHALRKHRKTLIGEFAWQEELIEQLEGRAECCCLLALKQLDEQKYIKRLSDYACILQKEEGVFDVRRISYYSGALIYVLENETTEEEGAFSDRISLHREKQQADIDEFFKQDRKEHRAEASICGYDPMNQIRVGDLLLAKHMVFLNIKGKASFIEGPVVLKMKEGSFTKLEAYYL